MSDDLYVVDTDDLDAFADAVYDAQEAHDAEVAKHLGSAHDQSTHGRRGTNAPTGDSPPVAEGVPEGPLTHESLDALHTAMGVIDISSGRGRYLAHGETITAIEADESGFPVLVDWVRKPGHPGEGRFFAERQAATARDVPYVFRAVSEADFQRIMSGGIADTDARMNLGADEGLVTSAPDSLPTFYLPGKLASQRDTGLYEGRIVRIRLAREDGWRLDHNDSYIKTSRPVPASRIDLVSPMLVENSGARAGGTTIRYSG